MAKKYKMLCILVCLLLIAFFKVRDTNPQNQNIFVQSRPGTEPDIDKFIGSWEDAEPYKLYGSLDVYHILTKCQGDPLNPEKKGAVLTDLNSVSYAILSALSSTEPSTLEDVQYIFYINSGEGVIKAGKRTGDLRHGIGIILPPGIEFTITNTGEEQLTMYIIEEPIPHNFTSNKVMIVRDEYNNPISTNRNRARYSRNFLFSMSDGLSKLVAVNPVMFEPNTLYPPHVHPPGEEEVWITIEGENLVQLGLKRRLLPAGSAYKVPPDGRTPHINMNRKDVSIKLMWLMKVPVERQPKSLKNVM